MAGRPGLDPLSWALPVSGSRGIWRGLWRRAVQGRNRSQASTIAMLLPLVPSPRALPLIHPGTSLATGSDESAKQ